MVRFAGDILIFRDISCFEIIEIYPGLLLKVFHASFLDDFFPLFLFSLFTPTISHPKKHNDEKRVTKTVHSLEDWKAAAFACLYGAWFCTTKT